MAKNSVAQKITRRLFNGIIGALAFFGFGKHKTEAKLDSIDQFQKEQAQDQAVDHMEVLFLPEDFIYPYSTKVREVLYNHLRAGKSRYEIKQWILEHSKVVRIPLK